MVTSAPPTPTGGAQTVSSALLRSNSSVLGSQGGSLHPPVNYSSLVLPQTQYQRYSQGNASDVATASNQFLGNDSLNFDISNWGDFQYGGINTVVETDPRSSVCNAIGFASPHSSFAPSNMANPSSSGQVQNRQILNPSGNQLFSDQYKQAPVPQQQALCLQQQQQQQQQPLKALTQQIPKSAVRPIYQPGMCARRLAEYMYQQKHRPTDNKIEFWRQFVGEFFAPNAKKRLCVTSYGNSRQTNGVFPQETWHCELCKRKPGRGFETTVEVLPRLFKIKYDSGTLEELLNVDLPHEYQDPSSGNIILDYGKAMQESVFKALRVFRDGKLRIVFSPDLKIYLWEFCAQNHDELISRRSIAPQVSQLGAAAQKYQAAAQNAISNSSMQDLKSTSSTFLASAHQLQKAMEVPLVNELGYTKRYVRCLQISEVVNSMTDLIGYERETRKGPMECLAKFPHRSSSSSRLHNTSLQQPEQQQLIQNLNNGDNSAQDASIQLSGGNCVANVNNSHCATSTITSATNTVGLLTQNSINSIQSPRNNPSSPCAGTPVQMLSAGPSTTPPATQPYPSSLISCLTPSSYNNMHKMSQSIGADPNKPMSSVERIIQEVYGGAGSMVDVGANSMNNIKN